VIESISGKLQVEKGWTCTEGWGKEPGKSYVIELISVKLQVKKGWTCTEGWREGAR
jgi:hypothetical protein